MAVPRYFWFIDLVLHVLREEGKPLEGRELRGRAPKLMDLTGDELRELAGEKGNQSAITKVADQTGWATTHAGKMGWVEGTSRGYWRITDAGTRLLDEHPNGIPEQVYRETQVQWRQG